MCAQQKSQKNCLNNSCKNFFVVIFVAVLLLPLSRSFAQNPQSPAPAPTSPASPAAAGATAAPQPVAPTKPANNMAFTGEEAKQKFDTANEYSFNPLKVVRDPFQPPKDLNKLEDPLEENDENRQCARRLPMYDINQLSVVGIMRGSRETHAIINLPTGLSCIVQVGSRMGRRNGVVIKISATEVLIREKFTDYQNREKPDVTTLVLAQ